MSLRTGAIDIKTSKEVEGMRRACSLAAQTLDAVSTIIRPGLTTLEIDEFVRKDTLDRGCLPACLNYRGFPKHCCTSINEVVCHGIPSQHQTLADGDIINVDITHIHNGFFGDTSATFYVGTPSPDAIRVTEVARRALELGIAQVRPGARLGDIGAAIQEFAEAQGCSVVRQFVGHGIGRRFHEEPQVSHVGQWGRGARLKPGMTFTIEPMINVGTWEVEILGDGWTAVTADTSLSAQFEHTLLVTLTGVEILTARSRPLSNSELYGDYFGSKAG
jgi:methionyl aminopeptidase